MKIPGNSPHRRYNPLTGEWVLVSAQRTARPWLGQMETAGPESGPEQDEMCYLCPGGTRADGSKNPDYSGTFVFTNDFPALLPDSENAYAAPHDSLLRWDGVSGTSRVICYSPRHDLTLPEFAVEDIASVVRTWIRQSAELAEHYQWVQIFENKGSAMGASNPHPHGQIWAGSFLPTEAAKEDRQQRDYYREQRQTLLGDYLALELVQGDRIVAQNDSWVVAVPFWAIWPFETILLPRPGIRRITDLDPKMINDLAAILKVQLTKYDHLFNVSFPYSMGWHGAPNNGEDNEHWTLHAHFYPPLLRSAAIRKFMVGYEMLAEAQRDLTAESAARRLAALPGNY